VTTEKPPESDAGDTLPAGTPLLQGQFLIEDYLNSGGFGITYLARDSLERRVVIKECFPSSMCCRIDGIVRARARTHQSEFDAVVRLFGQEARRLAKLEHPNIVGVRDVFEENGTAYMALDYIEGRDLHDIIEKETWRLDPDTIRQIALALLDAIGHVHAKGILHRDISPDNVLLTHDGVPVLIDFGAARDTARRASRILSTLHVVKDGYSPQEFYLQAGEQSPASDLYSLAATLYRAITGEAPTFSHRRLAAIAERQPDPYKPLAGVVEEFDAPFLQMIDKALSIFAKDRPQTAAEWLTGLSRAAGAATSEADELDIVERVRRLVEATNPEVMRLQERRAREQAEAAARAVAERTAFEEAQRRRFEEARREAEEAERAYQQRRREEEEERQRREAAREATEPEAGEGEATRLGAVVTSQEAVVAHVPGAGGINRAKLLKEREERLRREAQEAAEAAAKGGGRKAALVASTAKLPDEEEAERPERASLLGRILSRSRSRRRGQTDEPSSEGYGT